MTSKSGRPTSGRSGPRSARVRGRCSAARDQRDARDATLDRTKTSLNDRDRSEEPTNAMKGQLWIFIGQKSKREGFSYKLLNSESVSGGAGADAATSTCLPPS